MRQRLSALGVALALSLPALAHQAPAELDFALPAPGSYGLPPIQAAPHGEVVESNGKRGALSAYTRGRITLVGLVYTRCTDPDGCPLATWAFSEVRSLLRSDRALERRVRLVSLSFDPDHDTPAVLAAYARRSKATRPGAQWRFVTARSHEGLARVLEGFGQDLRVASDSNAAPGSEEFTHTLKVFLLDPAGAVREIYATAYLMPRMIVNDIRTLALEGRATGTPR